MPKKLTIPGDWSAILCPIHYISYWGKGEMAFTAMKKINEHKANNDWNKAGIMLEEWIL